MKKREECRLREAAYVFHGCLYIFYVWLVIAYFPYGSEEFKVTLFSP
jgi:hypothetical protein